MVIIRGGQKLGETIIYLRNWNYSHSQALHHQTRGRCASNSIRDIWSGDTFHIKSVTSKHGLLQKVLSASTLAHQKGKLILQDDQNKTPSSDFFPPSPQVFLRVRALIGLPSCSPGIMGDGLRKPTEPWWWVGGWGWPQTQMPSWLQVPGPRSWQQA